MQKMATNDIFAISQLQSVNQVKSKKSGGKAEIERLKKLKRFET